MDIKEIKILSIAELNHLLEDLRKKFDDLKFKATQKQLKNIREIRVVKKDIARILMTLKEKNKTENIKS
ncbi:50S ribosomal protein L29 [Candidatus Falkowbacteria bacterium]|nr:50S ribosomal protein L29 [Candidatus Falkowbacteria bacterium]